MSKSYFLETLKKCPGSLYFTLLEKIEFNLWMILMDLFLKFTQAIKFYNYNCPIL